MSRADEEMGKPANFESDRAVWRYCRATDAPEDEPARFLDLAAFADGLLIEEERDRVACLLASDPAAAADVAAAQALATVGMSPPAARQQSIARIIARADPLVGDGETTPGRVLPLRTRPARSLAHRFAQWGSLAAAIAVASWLGFAMGSGASLTLSQPVPTPTMQNGEPSFLPELLDPTTGFLRDLTGARQT